MLECVGGKAVYQPLTAVQHFNKIPRFQLSMKISSFASIKISSLKLSNPIQLSQKHSSKVTKRLDAKPLALNRHLA